MSSYAPGRKTNPTLIQSIVEMIMKICRYVEEFLFAVQVFRQIELAAQEAAPEVVAPCTHG